MVRLPTLAVAVVAGVELAVSNDHYRICAVCLEQAQHEVERQAVEPLYLCPTHMTAFADHMLRMERGTRPDRLPRCELCEISPPMTHAQARERVDEHPNLAMRACETGRGWHVTRI